MPFPWLVALAVGSSIASGYASSRAARKGGAAAREAAYANAEDLREFGEFNSQSLLAVGAVNAQAIVDIGEVNASYIERATDRNMYLYGLEADEDVNRHIRAEKQVAGDIRAKASGSGIQVNTGSPLQFLNAQVDEGLRQRDYMILTHTETILSMAEEGKDRAFVTRFTAEKNAEVTMFNAEANAAMALESAELSATQQENSGELAYEQGAIAGQNAMIQGITSAISYGAQAYKPQVATQHYGGYKTSFRSWGGSYAQPSYGT